MPFVRGEHIWTESSYKYEPDQIERMGVECGLRAAGSVDRCRCALRVVVDDGRMIVATRDSRLATRRPVDPTLSEKCDSLLAEIKSTRHLFRCSCDGPLRAPRQRHRYVTRTAEQSIVFQSALATAVSNRNNVIGFPAGARGAPDASSGAIRHWRLRSRPLPVRLHDIEAADLADTLVALFDLLANLPGTASDFPFVDAGVAAERASWRLDRTATPPANRFACGIAIWLSPLLGGDDTRALGAHALGYRRE